MSAAEAVGDREMLARYVLSGSWLYKDGRERPLKPNAWLPHPRVELSVFRIDGWDECKVVEQGEKVAAEREEKHRRKMLDEGRDYPADKTTFRYLGRGEILSNEVRACGLEVLPKEPPPCHADIVNWPPLTGNRKHDESAQMAYALKMAAFCSFVAALP